MIWEVKPIPGRGLLGVLKVRLWSFVMVLLIGAILLVLLGVNATLTALGRFLDPVLIPGSLQLLNFAISFVFLTLLIALVYQILPDVQIGWRDVWVGASLSALLFLLGNYLISLYLSWAGVVAAS